VVLFLWYNINNLKIMFFKPKSTLGVDLGSGGVKLVELHQQKGRPVLFTYGYTTGAIDMQEVATVVNLSVEHAGIKKQLTPSAKSPLKDESSAFSQENIDKYATLLKSVYKSARCTAKEAIVSLPVSAIFHAVVTMPKMAKKEEFAGVLRAEVQKLLPRPLEELSLDYQVLPGPAEAKSQRVLVNAVSRSLVAFYSRVFNKVGLRLESLEPESAALSRALIGRDQNITMLVDMGARRTNFFIVDKGIPVTHHSIEIGGSRASDLLRGVLQIDSKFTEQIKYDLSEFLSHDQLQSITSQKFIEIITPFIDPIIREIKYSFDLYLSQIGNEGRRPEKVILTGGAAQLPFIAQYISDTFQMKSYVGDPWARAVYQEGLKPVLGQIGSRMAVAIGLALRNMV